MPALRQITDATAEPVTLDDIKLHLRLQTTDTTEDEYLSLLIKSARKEVENRTRRLLMPQTFKLFADDFEDEMILPLAPLSTESSDIVITYFDSASGNSTTLSSTVYRIDADSEPGRICLGHDQEWPDVYDVKNAVQIQFKAGYPINTAATPATDTCPEALEQWIKMRVTLMYEQREPYTIGRMAFNVPRHFDGLLDPYALIEVDP